MVSPARTKVLFIAGAGRSCTTLVGHILGQAEGFCFIGEAMYGWRALGDRLCGCGAALDRCEFWNAVRRTASAGRAPEASEFFGLGRLARWRHLPLTFLPGREGRLASRYGRHWRGTEELYAAVAAVSGAEVIVDSSKSVPYGRMLTLLPALDVRVLHLVRDARGVAHSWSRRKLAPDRSSDTHMRYRGPVRSAVYWGVSNAATELLCRDPERHLRLRYESFVERPREAIERIVRMVTGRPAEVPFAGDRTVTLAPTHSIKGNPDRLQVGPVEIRLDARWRTQMAARDRGLVTALSWPLLARYGYLTRAPAASPSSPRPAWP